MKKLLIAFLLLALAVAMVGCGRAKPFDCDCHLCSIEYTSPEGSGGFDQYSIVVDCPFEAFATALDQMGFTHDMTRDDFYTAIRTITLECGNTIYETGLYYIRTTRFDTHFGYRNASYSVHDNGCCSLGVFSVEVSASPSNEELHDAKVALPAGVNIGDTSQKVMTAFGFVEYFERRNENYYGSGIIAPRAVTLANEDETKTVFIVYKPPGFESPSSFGDNRISFRETIETVCENGVTHTYRRTFSLVFRQGQLNAFRFSVNRICDYVENNPSENPVIGMTMANPEFRYGSRDGHNFSIRFDKIYLDNETVHLIYTVQSDNSFNLRFMYETGDGDDIARYFYENIQIRPGGQTIRNSIDFSYRRHLVFTGQGRTFRVFTGDNPEIAFWNVFIRQN